MLAARVAYQPLCLSAVPQTDAAAPTAWSRRVPPASARCPLLRAPTRRAPPCHPAADGGPPQPRCPPPPPPPPHPVRRPRRLPPRAARRGGAPVARRARLLRRPRAAAVAGARRRGAGGGARRRAPRPRRRRDRVCGGQGAAAERCGRPASDARPCAHARARFCFFFCFFLPCFPVSPPARTERGADEGGGGGGGRSAWFAVPAVGPLRGGVLDSDRAGGRVADGCVLCFFVDAHHLSAHRPWPTACGVYPLFFLVVVVSVPSLPTSTDPEPFRARPSWLPSLVGAPPHPLSPLPGVCGLACSPASLLFPPCCTAFPVPLPFPPPYLHAFCLSFSTCAAPPPRAAVRRSRPLRCTPRVPPPSPGVPSRCASGRRVSIGPRRGGGGVAPRVARARAGRRRARRRWRQRPAPRRVAPAPACWPTARVGCFPPPPPPPRP